MRTLVMKFGGTSVGNISALSQVVGIVLQEHERWDRLLLVVSALEGVTDALIDAAQLARLSNRRGYRRIAATIRTRHLALVDQLPIGVEERSTLQADIDHMLFEMLEICQSLAQLNDETSPYVIDSITSIGEKLAARIVAALLRQNKIRGVAIDASEFIVTDSTPGNAQPNMEMTQSRIREHLLPMLDRKIVPVITGFIARNLEGRQTTLGRGGSDYSASIISVSVEATEMWMWTIVDGIMTADPHTFPDAKVIEELSYNEVAEIAYFGARIIHAHMISPLLQKQIPLRIKNVFKPQQNGTLVHHISAKTSGSIKSITMINGVSLTASHSGTLTEILTVVDDVLHKTVSSHADVMISAQSVFRTTLCFIIPTTSGPDALHRTEEALKLRLKEEPVHQHWQVHPVNILTVIGSGLNTLAGQVAQVLTALNSVPILALAQNPSNCSVSVVVNPEDADYAVSQMHTIILNNGSNSGPTPNG